MTQVKEMLSKTTVDVLYRVKRGLAGYVSYLAACEMNQAFSEYVLYEPILRILNGNGYAVQCEYECPGIEQPARGDKKRIDFFAIGKIDTLAIEVKWTKSSKPKIAGDLTKLRAILKQEPSVIPLLCLFGRKSDLEEFAVDGTGLEEKGKARYADLGKTRFGCRIFRLMPKTRPKKH